LTKASLLWDNPTVKLTADDKGRITSSELFRPRTTYDASRLPDGTIRIVELVEKEVPVVRARKIGGRWVGADVKLDRKAVVDSIRTDREER
jgi:hypothetical protein